MKKFLLLVAILTVGVVIFTSCAAELATGTLTFTIDTAFIILMGAFGVLGIAYLVVTQAEFPISFTVGNATITLDIDFSGSMAGVSESNQTKTMAFCVSPNEIKDVEDCQANIAGTVSIVPYGHQEVEISSPRIVELLNEGHRSLYVGFILDSGNVARATLKELRVTGK